MVLLIDNYDSFTYNLSHYVQSLGSEVLVLRNDAMSAEAMFALRAKAAIISPGPSSPKNAGVCVEFIKMYAGQIPIFGVCLGMQAIAEALGGQIVLAKRVMHGKVDSINHNGNGAFKGIPSPMSVVRYHSLAVDYNTIPSCLEITATSSDGEIMGIRHKDFLLEGVQFHPESIMSYGGKRILANFLNEVESI